MCQSRTDHKKFLVVLDHFSKYAEALPCQRDDLTTERTLQIRLNKWFGRHGTPSIDRSDNGKPFVAEVTQCFKRAAQLKQV